MSARRCRTRARRRPAARGSGTTRGPSARCPRSLIRHPAALSPRSGSSAPSRLLEPTTASLTANAWCCAIGSPPPYGRPLSASRSWCVPHCHAFGAVLPTQRSLAHAAARHSFSPHLSGRLSTPALFLTVFERSSAQHSQGLAEDTPIFRQSLHRKHGDAVDFEAKARKVVASVEKYLEAMTGFGDLTACIEEVLPDAMGNSSAGAAHDVIKLFGDLTEKMDALSKTVGAMVVDPINGYLDGDLKDAKDHYSLFLDKQKAVDKSRIEYMKMTSDTGTEFLATKEKALGEVISFR